MVLRQLCEDLQAHTSLDTALLLHWQSCALKTRLFDEDELEAKHSKEDEVKLLEDDHPSTFSNLQDDNLSTCSNLQDQSAHETHGATPPLRPNTSTGVRGLRRRGF